MKFSSILLATSVNLIAAAAFAQTTSTSASSIGVAPAATEASTGSASATTSEGENKGSLKEILKNKKFAEDTDITDAKLKADAGSLSKYSLKFNLSYYGPMVGDLGAKDQPNPDGSISPHATAISGSFGGRYRIDSASSISMGTGMKANHPFHGMDRFDINDPFLGYDRLIRFGDLQMRMSPSVSYITTPEYKDAGEYAGMGYDTSLIYNLGTSHMALGLDASLGYYLYGRDYRNSDRSANQYTVSTYPTFKYNFTDKLNINTSVKLAWANFRRAHDKNQLIPQTISQRLGVGYALTRDIYLFPYLNFYPNSFTQDSTTLNFLTSFSIL